MVIGLKILADQPHLQPVLDFQTTLRNENTDTVVVIEFQQAQMTFENTLQAIGEVAGVPFLPKYCTPRSENAQYIDITHRLIKNERYNSFNSTRSC